MDIYIVKGNADRHGYMERVQILENMEEKPKSFVGIGRKINKSKVDKLEEGMFYGSYKIILTDKSKIPEARKRIKEAIYKYYKTTLERTQNIIKHIEEHSLEFEVRFKDY